MKPNDQQKPDAGKEKEEFPGYPKYPESEDIYSRSNEEKEIDPETLERKPNPQRTQEHSMDIPGAEDDDVLEEIGSEDEENNYYSLGGENHEDLEDHRDDFDANGNLDDED